MPAQQRETHNVSGRGHGAESAALDVDSQSNNGTDQRAELEDCPEHAEGLALILLKWVTHHDGALCGPEERRGETEHSTSEDEEPAGSLGLEASLPR